MMFHDGEDREVVAEDDGLLLLRELLLVQLHGRLIAAARSGCIGVRLVRLLLQLVRMGGIARGGDVVRLLWLLLLLLRQLLHGVRGRSRVGGVAVLRRVQLLRLLLLLLLLLQGSAIAAVHLAAAAAVAVVVAAMLLLLLLMVAALLIRTGNTLRSSAATAALLVLTAAPATAAMVHLLTTAATAMLLVLPLATIAATAAAARSMLAAAGPATVRAHVLHLHRVLSLGGLRGFVGLLLRDEKSLG